MRYQIADAPELTHLLLSGFTSVPQPAIEKGLDRYLWRHARFAYAEQLADVLDDVRSGRTGHFFTIKRATSFLRIQSMAFISCCSLIWLRCTKQIFAANT